MTIAPDLYLQVAVAGVVVAIVACVVMALVIVTCGQIRDEEREKAQRAEEQAVRLRERLRQVQRVAEIRDEAMFALVDAARDVERSA
jgi:uncharacterized protein YlxW (UPF0749 family)